MSKNTETLFTKYESIRLDLKEKLEPRRYEHSVSVAFTASCLAMRYGVDVEKAYLAGLLHDCAKHDQETYLERAEKARLRISEAEKRAPGLLHAPLGAIDAREKYGVTDEEILSAIRYHTIGRPAMTALEKIIYVADYVEPLREGLRDLDAIRSEVFVNIDRAIALTASACVEHLIRENKPLDKTSLETYKYYKKLTEGDLNEF